MSILGTHIQEVAVIVLFGRVINALVCKVGDIGDHPLHVGELVLHPATGISLKFTIWELVSSGRGGRRRVRLGGSYPRLGGLRWTVFSQVVVKADGVKSCEARLVVVVGVKYLEDKSVGLEADLSSPPLFVILKPAVRQVPDVVNVAFVTLSIDL